MTGKQKISTRDIRGAYTHYDVNRVLCAMDYIAGWLGEYGYDRTGYAEDPRAPYGPEDAMRLMDTELYLRNVEALRGALAVPEGTPETPEDMRAALDLPGANTVESILVAVDALRPLLERSWWYSGEIYCGEV